MKTTVRTGKNRRFVVTPVPQGVSVRMELRTCVYNPNIWDLAALFTLTPDQAGALIFGIEQALEAAGTAQDRAAAKFWTPAP